MTTSKLNSATTAHPAPFAFEVQTRTLADGWINTWRYENADGDMLPETFPSREAAGTALEEYLHELVEDVALGNLSDYDPEDFRVHPLANGITANE